jgi:hypothetical protein
MNRVKASRPVPKDSIAASEEDHAEELRQRLTEFMHSKGLTVTRWAKNARVTEGALRAFLGGRSKTLTHATLFRLANAVQEPVAALLRGKSIWGNTVRIEVATEVSAAKETTIELERTSFITKYSIQVPMPFPEEVYFGAEVGDDSVDEKWKTKSILVCAEFGWSGRFEKLSDGDFLLIQEKRTRFESDGGGQREYFRITVRELVNHAGETFLMMRSKNPRLRDSILIHSQLIGETVKGPIATGLGSEVKLLGKVLASFVLQPEAET